MHLAHGWDDHMLCVHLSENRAQKCESVLLATVVHASGPAHGKRALDNMRAHVQTIRDGQSSASTMPCLNLSTASLRKLPSWKRGCRTRWCSESWRDDFVICFNQAMTFYMAVQHLESTGWRPSSTDLPIPLPLYSTIHGLYKLQNESWQPNSFLTNFAHLRC